jgi:prepilin-type processing-associated H-X9-DG protein
VNEQVPATPPRVASHTSRILIVAGLLIGVTLLVSLALPAFNPPRKGRAPRAWCMSYLRQIGLAIDLYADEHGGKIPRRFDDLNPYATHLDKLLICPAAKDTNHPSYQILLAGHQWKSIETTNAIVVTEPLSNHGSGRNALYGDGHVAWLSN